MTEPVTVAQLHTRTADPYVNAAYNKVSWGAIFAGVAITLTTHILLTLLGIGLGAAVIDPASSDNPAASTMSISSGVWFVVTGLIAFFVGGYVASRLSGRPLRSTGSLHGVASWAVTTLVTLYLLTTSVGAIVGGTFSGVGSLISGAGSTISTAATTAAPSIATAADPMADIERSVRQASGGNDPAALRDTAVASVRAMLTGDPAQIEEARTRSAEALARAQNIPVDQARQQVQQYETQYRQSVEEAKKQATEAAQVAATAISAGSIFAFISLAVGAIAAWIGGAVGTTYVTRDDELQAARYK